MLIQNINHTEIYCFVSLPGLTPGIYPPFCCKFLAISSGLNCKIVYTYENTDELELTAVYEDFLNMEGRYFGNTYNDLWNGDTNQYVGDANGWYNMGYLTESLKKNMFIEFEIGQPGATAMQMFDFGVSRKSFIETYNAGQGNTWLLSGSGDLAKLYAPEFNMYSGNSLPNKESFSYLLPNSTNTTTGKTYYDGANIDFNTLLKNKVNGGQRLTIRIVLTDKAYVYIDGQLFTATNLPEYTIEDGQEYIFSFWGTYSLMEIVDFGYITAE